MYLERLYLIRKKVRVYSEMFYKRPNILRVVNQNKWGSVNHEQDLNRETAYMFMLVHMRACHCLLYVYVHCPRILGGASRNKFSPRIAIIRVIYSIIVLLSSKRTIEKTTKNKRKKFIHLKKNIT